MAKHSIEWGTCPKCLTSVPYPNTLAQLCDKCWKADLHRYISYIKSIIRLIGYVFIPISLPIAATILFVSEIGGIVEELFGA